MRTPTVFWLGATRHTIYLQVVYLLHWFMIGILFTDRDTDKFLQMFTATLINYWMIWLSAHCIVLIARLDNKDIPTHIQSDPM